MGKQRYRNLPVDYQREVDKCNEAMTQHYARDIVIEAPIANCYCNSYGIERTITKIV